MHLFDQAIHLKNQNGRLWGRTSAAYANMVGPFGGVTAAAMLKGVMDHPDRLGEPLSQTVNFAAPVQAGEFEVQVRPLRTNRSTQHWLMTLEQDGQPAATSTALFARRRETWSSTELAFPDVPPMDAVKRLSNDALPPWPANYDIRFVKGTPTFFAPIQEEKAADSETVQWVRDDPPRPLDFLSLTAMCDIFFPRIFFRRRRFMPVGTVTMTNFFHVDEKFLAAFGDREILAVARANRFGLGYFDQTAALWSQDGTLLATSTQMVYFKSS